MLRNPFLGKNKSYDKLELFSCQLLCKLNLTLCAISMNQVKVDIIIRTVDQGRLSSRRRLNAQTAADMLCRKYIFFKGLSDQR